MVHARNITSTIEYIAMANENNFAMGPYNYDRLIL